MTKTTTITRTTLRLVRETVVIVETTGEEATTAPAAIRGPGIVRALPGAPTLRLVSGGAS